ncbi:MAG: TonB-dependent receptor [Bacteroidales bacterium]|nr:TonB-dependent receptor [Bacteroidales bacterium]
MAYFKYRNENLAGKTPTDDETDEREKLDDFSAKTYGFNVSGPIVKNKLFFFANVEIQADATPQPFNASNYEGTSTVAELNDLRTYMINNYNHDPGGFENNTRELRGRKAFLKLDWNINSKHSLMLRHQYTYGEAIDPYRSNPRSISFYNSGVVFPSTANTTALELKSRFSDELTNNLKIGYSYIHDDRNTMGGRFPGVTIDDGAGKIYAGGEIYSTGNELKQSIFTITDNLQLTKGKHFLTFGTHNEFYGIYNLFMRRAYGDYEFDSVQDFRDGDPSFYRIGYSQVDDIRGDGSAAAAEFNFMQFGLYVQDEIKINEDLKVTAGVRLDMPVFTDSPGEIDQFNDTTIVKLENHYDLEGARSGQMPFTQFLVSPRVGFNWDVNGTKTTQIRGGVGIFTSRLPLVWPAGSYTNNGLMMGDYRDYSPDPGSFEWDPDEQYVPAKISVAAAGSQIDLYAKDFKLPQMLRANLAVDQKLPGDFVLTLEGIYTKTINNVLWKDVNIKPAWGNATGTGDDRPLYRTYRNGVESYYGQIMLGANTNLGYTYNLTAQLRKDFAVGLSSSVAYTFGRAKSVFDGTSSQNSSQWNYLVSSPVPRNEAELGISSFDLGHRIVAALNYEIEYLNMFKTTVSLFYTGQSGRPVSYIYDDYSGSFTNEAYRGPQLIYVPENENDIYLVDIPGGATAAEQWDDLDAYISQNDYLSSRRGQYAERNGSRLPWENILDLRIVQDIYYNVKDRKQTLQITFDVFNFGNLLNQNWGRRYYASNGNIALIDYYDRVDDPSTAGTTEETLPLFQFYKPSNDRAYYIDDSGLNSSRWQARLGIRYIF